MKVLLLVALACLVSATEEPLPSIPTMDNVSDNTDMNYNPIMFPIFSGNFTTIYLASKIASVTGENSQFRMLMREVKFFKNYTLMSMTFYVRKNGKCQLHTVWADKSPFKLCTTMSFYDLEKCFKNRENEFIVGTWFLRDSIRHFPHIYTFHAGEGGRYRIPSIVFVLIHFVWNTTIVLETNYVNRLGNTQILTAALAKGPNITEEMWKEYVNLTHYYEIPTRNIKNVYEADACPQ